MELKNMPQLKENVKGFSIDYQKLKKCFYKKELGETTDECQRMWKDLGIEGV